MILISLFLALIPMPEELIYDVRFGPFHAGEIILKIEDMEGIYRITCSEKTNEAISCIYRVNDRYEVWTDSAFKPILYEARIEEGKYKRNRKIAFYHQGGFAVYNDKDTVSLTKGARELFSLIYYIRALCPSSGDTILVTLHDGRKNREVVIPISETKIGDETYLVASPDVRDIKVFGGRGLSLYYDEDMIPSILCVNIKFGSIKATRRKTE